MCVLLVYVCVLCVYVLCTWLYGLLMFLYRFCIRFLCVRVRMSFSCCCVVVVCLLLCTILIGSLFDFLLVVYVRVRLLSVVV